MPAHATVLVVDDDAQVRRTVRLTCEAEGYSVTEVARGAEAVAAVNTAAPDIVVLDLMMPDVSGFDVCREIRRTGNRVPVIILSARQDEIDVVLGLEIGADDYVQKPFRPRELLARIGAQLRRSAELSGLSPRGRRLLFDGLVVDTGARRVLRDGADVELTHTQFELLAFLALHAGQVLSRERLLAAVWGFEAPVVTRVIDVHVRNLRLKLEQDPNRPEYILSVPGVGYRFSNRAPATDGGPALH